ncbi:MAG: hypothetical protein KKD18_03265 [Nanoarchaeota archaeon]|nr:hypothetical protein [Nanoarchaeota archaeon]
MTEEMIPKETETEDTGQTEMVRLKALADSILDKRDEAVNFRTSSGVERRWREDEAILNTFTDGEKTAMMDYATGEASPRTNKKEVSRSRVVVNILRSKCETAEGRFTDVMFPIEDKNWELKTTPVPTLLKALGDDRQVINTQTKQPMIDQDNNPVKASDIAGAQTEEAKTKMKAMDAEVSDQLVECRYNGECRKVIRDATRTGTGVLKGPNVINQVKKVWMPQDNDKKVYGIHIVEDSTPESRRVDYWNVYPDPQCGEDINRAGYIWEYDEILPRELRAFIGLEGYFQSAIEKILTEEPYRTTYSYNKQESKTERQRKALTRGQPYEKWEYHGDVDREDLEALGVECSDLKGRSLSACVVFVNDIPIKVQLNILDTGDLPYDFFQWCGVKNSPWGIGILRIGAWAQQVITAAWRATMDNASDSSGANIVVSKGVEPMDGDWVFAGRKFWRGNGDIDDASKAFHQFQIESHQAELQAIIELAMRFLDMETALPAIFEDERQQAPETLGATNIMVDSANVAIRTRVKTWDDQITKPHITRYYNWNMQYSDDPDIKGDFNVDPKGVSVLLARDQQARTLVELMRLKGDPDVDSEINWGKGVRELFTSLKLDVLKTDEEKKQDEANKKNTEPQMDPALQVAKIRAEGELKKAELVQKSDMEELQFKAQEAGLDRQHQTEIKIMEREIKMMELSQTSGLSLDKIKADLAKEFSKQKLMRELADKKTPQIATPPIEPPGRAKEGQAYQA